MTTSGSDWLAFLHAQGAESTGGAVVRHFGDPGGERAACRAGGHDLLCPLTGWGTLAVAGADAATFLQGQLTGDIDDLTRSGRAPLSAYCSPKGRVLGLFRVLDDSGEREPRLLLATAADRLEALAQRLRLFVLRARVTLGGTDDPVWLGLSGPGVGHLLRHTIGEVPDAADRVARHDRVRIVRVAPAGDDERFLLAVDAGAATAVWQALTSLLRPVGGDCWRLLDIRAGLPSVYTATADRFLPQAIALDRLGAVSFDKGCYVGQEIVARTQYLGRIKRRLVHIEGSGPAPAPGSTLSLAGEADDSGGDGSGSDEARDRGALGIVVDAVATGDGTFEGLAVLSESAGTTPGETTLLAVTAPAPDPAADRATMRFNELSLPGGR